MSISHLHSEDSFDEEREPLYDSRASYMLTNDEIMRQFVQEIDESTLLRDTQVALAFGETEEQ